MTSLNNKTALVTGGSRSLGKDIALSLAQAGADVCISYRSREEEARATVNAIRAVGRKAEALQVDLNGTGQMSDFVDRFHATLADWGTQHFDILIHNAGISCDTPLPALSEEQLDAQYNTNYKSVVFLTQALLASIRDGGRIITIGSGATRFSIPSLIGYAPIKAALEHFTRNLAAMLGERGITANALSPGALDTDFNREVFARHPEMLQFISSVTALGRVGLAEDIGGVAAFLCSDDARWITGQRLEVSGGMFL